MKRPYALALAVLAAASCAALAPHAARAGGCWSGYSYVGVQSSAAGYGVSASLTLASVPVVAHGHVAAWVGIGDASEWVQAGVAHDEGGGDVLYFEYKRPSDSRAVYVALQPVAAGETHTVAVYERPAQRDAWRVLIDGVRVSDPIVLPGSHGLFRPVATTESWDGGVSGTCNAYRFGFANLALRAQWGGAWQPFDLTRILRDPAYVLSLRPAGFSASSR
jgi:hypothetical protein